MQSYQKTFLAQTGTIADSIRIIEEGGVQICLVVDEGHHLRGTVTDGDVRRGLLKSLPLDAPVTTIMKQAPRFAHPDDDAEKLLALMRKYEVRQIPVCDGSGRVVGLATHAELSSAPAARDNWVVLMAGGLGQRLRPLTNDLPKPLLKVGNKPLLETILDMFLAEGFHKFYISVNYKAEMVKSYFEDGSKWNCTIEYLEEDRRMGTAGALGLIPEPPTKPMIVMNGDLLTKVRFSNLVDFHAEQNALATMCVREYDMQIPYGVVEIDQGRITSLIEKPVHTFFVNAGIYVIDPSLLPLIPRNGAFDMTELFTRAIEQGKLTAVFPVREYWLDIGRPDDFDRANGEFTDNFD